MARGDNRFSSGNSLASTAAPAYGLGGAAGAGDIAYIFDEVRANTATTIPGYTRLWMQNQAGANTAALFVKLCVGGENAVSGTRTAAAVGAYASGVIEGPFTQADFDAMGFSSGQRATGTVLDPPAIPTVRDTLAVLLFAGAGGNASLTTIVPRTPYVSMGVFGGGTTTAVSRKAMHARRPNVTHPFTIDGVADANSGSGAGLLSGFGQLVIYAPVPTGDASLSAGGSIGMLEG